MIYLPAQRAGVSVLANRNDRYASHVALAVARTLVAGGDLAAHYLALAGIPAPAGRAEAQATEIAGRWHEPDQDVFVRFEADGGHLVQREHGGEQRFVLATDGSWHGTGPAAGGTYTAADGALVAGWGLSASPQGRYRRAEPAPEGSSARPVPAGIFRNEELRAYAELEAGESGALTVVIGLAPPRRLGPAGDGVWATAALPELAAESGEAGGPLTVRIAQDASALLVSVPGAHHVRFDRVPGAPADGGVLRGLRGAR